MLWPRAGQGALRDWRRNGDGKGKKLWANLAFCAGELGSIRCYLWTVGKDFYVAGFRVAIDSLQQREFFLLAAQNACDLLSFNHNAERQFGALKR